MSTGTAENPVKIVIDTNIIISGVGFGGKPRKILKLVLENKIKAITSPILLAELEEVINKKFPKLADNFKLINKKLKSKFRLVRPRDTVDILKADPDDNRVLEAAALGKCKYIVTGDRELLKLGTFQNIQIFTPDEFIDTLKLVGKW